MRALPSHEYGYQWFCAKEAGSAASSLGRKSHHAAPAPVPASICIGRMNFLRVRELAKKIHAMAPRLFNSTREGSRWKIKLIGRDLGPAAT